MAVAVVGLLNTRVEIDAARRLKGLGRHVVALARHEARQLLVPIAILSVVGWAGTAAAPSLGHRPLLMMALSPRLAFLAVAARKVSLVPFLAVGMVRLTIADPFHFFLGRRHGTAMIEKAARFKPVAVARRMANRSIPLLVFLRPNGTNLALAGASRTKTMVVALADVVGTALYLVLVHQFGHAFL